MSSEVIYEKTHLGFVNIHAVTLGAIQELVDYARVSGCPYIPVSDTAVILNLHSSANIPEELNDGLLRRSLAAIIRDAKKEGFNFVWLYSDHQFDDEVWSELKDLMIVRRAIVDDEKERLDRIRDGFVNLPQYIGRSDKQESFVVLQATMKLIEPEDGESVWMIRLMGYSKVDKMIKICLIHRFTQEEAFGKLDNLFETGFNPSGSDFMN